MYHLFLLLLDLQNHCLLLTNLQIQKEPVRRVLDLILFEIFRPFPHRFQNMLLKKSSVAKPITTYLCNLITPFMAFLKKALLLLNGAFIGKLLIVKTLSKDGHLQIM